MIKILSSLFFSMLLLSTSISATASATTWTIVPAESSLSFTATQNNAPAVGNFKNFTGEIHFDPNQLSSSDIKIVVDISSVSDAYNQLADTLKSQDWFNVKIFPVAIFKSNEITKTGDKTYQVKGSLQIKDKTLPVVLNFTQVEYTETRAKMVGTTSIKRTAFGIGLGEWADTKAIKDDILINFVVVANKHI